MREIKKNEKTLSLEERIATLGKEIPREAFQKRGRVSSNEEEKRTKLWSQRYTDKEVAIACNTSSSAIAYWRRSRGLPSKHYRRLSPLENQKRLRLYNRGYTDSEIAAKLDLYPASIAQWRINRGLYRRSPQLIECEKQKQFLDYLTDKYSSMKKRTIFGLSRFYKPQINAQISSGHRKFIQKLRVLGLKTVYYFDDGNVSMLDDAAKLFVKTNPKILNFHPQAFADLPKEQFEALKFAISKVTTLKRPHRKIPSFREAPRDKLEDVSNRGFNIRRGISRRKASEQPSYDDMFKRLRELASRYDRKKK